MSPFAIGKSRKEDIKMTKEEKISELERMLRKCPEMLTPKKVCHWSPLGRNRVYELIKSKELRSFIFQGSYIITKDDLIDYLAEHSEDDSPKHYAVRKGGEQ